MTVSICDCGLPVGRVIDGKDEPGTCYAKTKYAESYEQDECYRRQITNLEVALAATLADREKIWEDGYGSGYSDSRFAKWGTHPNPHSTTEVVLAKQAQASRNGIYIELKRAQSELTEAQRLVSELREQVKRKADAIDQMCRDSLEANRDNNAAHAAEVSELRAERAKIWESAYDKGWANRDQKQSDWSVPDAKNPFLERETNNDE
jgi:hypothetical protein